MTFQEAEECLRSLRSTKEVGEAFEEMCCWLLLNHPNFRDKLDGVWLWRELDWGADIGVDIVVRDRGGRLWAIQAKALNPDSSITKRELDSFLTASASGYSRRLVIATTNRVGRNAQAALAGQNLRTELILRRDIESAEVDWRDWHGRDGRPTRALREPPMRPRPLRRAQGHLNLDQILAWADEHRRRTGDWPTLRSGPVSSDWGGTWSAINACLHQGNRGLPGGSSLARLLHTHRGVRHSTERPPLTEQQVLAWADEHRKRTGDWPHRDSGPVKMSPEDTWNAVDLALRRGKRGLSGGSSLARLLDCTRQVPNKAARPHLIEENVLQWARAHFARTGEWPHRGSGTVEDAPSETWAAVDSALAGGGRGLSGGTTLARLLAEHLGKHNHMALPPFTIEQILEWADEHCRRTGDWPTSSAGVISEAPSETWAKVNKALQLGLRGLSAEHGSLVKLLSSRRARRNRAAPPTLTERQILAWADEHYRRTRTWPTRRQGGVEEAPGETWSAIDAALARGNRGLPGGSSLPSLLAKHRGVAYRVNRPELTEAEIMAAAREHLSRTGTWPTRRAGRVYIAQGETTWEAIDVALKRGFRGLPGDSSLAILHTNDLG